MSDSTYFQGGQKVCVTLRRSVPLIVCSGKSEAAITKNKRLHSTYCVVEAGETCYNVLKPAK